MKKRFCLILALMLCLMTVSASALSVPRSTSSLPAMPSRPDAPEIVRVQTVEDAVTITLSTALPDDALVIALGLDGECLRYIALADPIGGNAFTATGLPKGGHWTGFEIDWTDSDGKAVAHYNAAGGLEHVTRYDRNFNEYIFDNDGRFCEFADAESGVRARFNTRGVMTSYGYEAFRSMLVWFSPSGNVVCASYNEGDGGIVADWEPGYGWYVNILGQHEKIKLNVKSPWNARPLIASPEADDPEIAETIHYPNNTICVCGLTLQEASASLPDKWYNVLPIDLTREGRQTYSLMISNMFYIGRCYVDVWEDEVTVSYSLIDSTAIRPLSSYGRWFTSLGQITAESIESTEGGFVFGQPVSISQDLGGADVALLFIRSKATYYQPFRDGTALTRYWRNKADWKEFREGLQELMPLVEK